MTMTLAMPMPPTRSATAPSAEKEALEGGGRVGPGGERVRRVGDRDVLGRGRVGGGGEHGLDGGHARGSART